MTPSQLIDRIGNRLRVEASRRLARRMGKLGNRFPIISFTFDDFPRTAVAQGGTILRKYGFAGTYYAAFGLMGRVVSPVGPMFCLEDVPELLAQGHELGCHTFAHCHAWKTMSVDFEKSIVDNRCALNEHMPGATFKSLSYPLWSPRPDTKRRAGRHFMCCRGGGQIYNSGWADLNLLAGFFLEQSVHDPGRIEEMIRRNAEQNGWLIFATHDVCENPTRFGVTPSLFEKVIKAAAGSRCRVLPVSEACEEAFDISGTKDVRLKILPQTDRPVTPKT